MIWFIIFVLWPLAELFVIVKVSEAIGFLWMLVLLILSWPLGTRILRMQGRAAWRRFVEVTRAGKPPTDQVLDGALVLTGGLLLMVPGFITDVIGLLLLIAPTRALVRRTVAHHHASPWVARAAAFGSSFGGYPRNTRARQPGRGQDFDADSTAVDIDNPEIKP